MCFGSIFIPGAAGQHDYKHIENSDITLIVRLPLDAYHFTAYTKHLMDVWFEEIAGKPGPRLINIRRGKNVY